MNDGSFMMYIALALSVVMIYGLEHMDTQQGLILLGIGVSLAVVFYGLLFKD